MSELTALRAELILAETRKATAEALFSELRVEQLEREIKNEKAQAAERRILTFADQVTATSVAIAIHHLDKWSQLSPGEDITIVFNSPGGDVAEGLALYDFIQELKQRGHKVTTKVLGSAHSMAAVLLQAGDERIITPYSRMLIHEVSASLQGNTTQREEAEAMIKEYQSDLLDILTERSTMTKPALSKKWKNRNWTLDAEAAVKLGFADRIGYA